MIATTTRAASSLINRRLLLTSKRPNNLSLSRLSSSGKQDESTLPFDVNTTTISNTKPSPYPEAWTKVHEPAYLAELVPKVGFYELLNLQIKGYDYVVLEKYQGYLHKTMKKMSFQVVKTWSAPYQELKIETLGDKTTAVENSYSIKIYERNLQMKDALVTKLPLLIDIINMTSPPGVSFSIHRHSSEDEDKIYFRDSVLEKLKEELQELKDTPLIGAA